VAASPKLGSEVLPLENGDTMTRAEFHWRYSQHPEIKKAELVEGVVHVASPVSIAHAKAHGAMTQWISQFLSANAGIDLLIEPTVLLDLQNEPQPDIVIRRARLSSEVQEQYIEAVPELVVETSLSSVSYDLHAKKNAYRRNGVQEYIVWRVFDGAIDWFALREGEYQLLAPDSNGVAHSGVFPGLRLALRKMLEGDLAGVLAAQGS
jgi:Uma2 family endonuclease